MNNKINQTDTFRHTNQVPAKTEALMIENGRAHRTDKNVNILSEAQLLLNRCADAFIDVLYFSDQNTLLKLRLVSKIIYQLSMQRSMHQRWTPLMCKIFIPLSPKGLLTEKIKFALANTAIHVRSLNIDYLKDTTLLGANIRKLNFSLSLEINNNGELKQLNTLLSSDELSNDQKFIISKIKELDLYGINVNNNNIDEINTLLNFFAKQEYSQLTILQFNNIDIPLTLPELPILTKLRFWNINSALNLPRLSNLTQLRFWNINTALTLPELPMLTKLSFNYIRDDATRKNLESLQKELSINSENKIEVQKKSSQEDSVVACLLLCVLF